MTLCSFVLFTILDHLQINVVPSDSQLDHLKTETAEAAEKAKRFAQEESKKLNRNAKKAEKRCVKDVVEGVVRREIDRILLPLRFILTAWPRGAEKSALRSRKDGDTFPATPRHGVPFSELVSHIVPSSSGPSHSVTWQHADIESVRLQCDSQLGPPRRSGLLRLQGG